jgi:hypothetical protein
MAVKFRHIETGLFFCRAKGLAPTYREVLEYGSHAIFLKRNLSKRGRVYEYATEKQKRNWIGEYADEFEIVEI